MHVLTHQFKTIRFMLPFIKVCLPGNHSSVTAMLQQTLCYWWTDPGALGAPTSDGSEISWRAWWHPSTSVPTTFRSVRVKEGGEAISLLFCELYSCRDSATQWVSVSFTSFILHVAENETVERVYQKWSYVGWVCFVFFPDKHVSTGTRNSKTRDQGLNQVPGTLFYPWDNLYSGGCISQKYRKITGGACSTEHLWLVEYPQNFISTTIFK